MGTEMVYGNVDVMVSAGFCVLCVAGGRAAVFEAYLPTYLQAVLGRYIPTKGCVL